MAARSTEVTLMNRTHNNLQKTGDHLDHGVWDSTPPLLIGDRGVWASESDGILTGTEGSVTYEIRSVEADGEQTELLGKVTMHWDNPFSGHNSYQASVSPQATAVDPGFSVGFFGGKGEDARVTFVVSSGLVEINPDTGEVFGTQASPVTTTPGAGAAVSNEHYAAVWVAGGPPFQARHGLAAAQVGPVGRELGPDFRPVHLSGYTVDGQDRYAAIWSKTPGPATEIRTNLSGQEYQQAFDQLLGQGFRPVHVSGYEIGGQDRYAAIWEQSAGAMAWQARHGLTAQQYQQAFDELLGQGFRLVHVDGYGVGGQDRYAAIWEKSPSPAWQARHGLTAQQYQQAFDELVGQGFRPLHVSGYRVGSKDRYAAIWVQDGASFQARHGLTSQQYQQAFDQLAADGFTLACVTGYGS